MNKAITQEGIEKASVEYADKTAKQYEVCNSEFVQEIMVAFEQGANFALGKQEKDTDTVIQGWLAIDEAYGQCFIHTEKPIQKAQPIADTGDYDTVWDSKGKTYLLDEGLFPDMDSDSEPEPVEIIIKRKKK